MCVPALYSDESIALLERYVLSVDKEKFFNTLIKGSDTYTRYRLLDQVNRHGLDMPSEAATLLTDLRSKDAAAATDTLVVFKLRLLEMETEKDPKKRREKLQEFNRDYLGSLPFIYNKPPNVERESDFAEGDTEVAVAPSTYDCLQDDGSSGSLLNLSLCLERYYRGEDDDLLLHLDPTFFHCVDLSKVAARRPADMAWIFKGMESYASIDNLPAVFAKYIKEEQKHQKTNTVSVDHYKKMTLQQLQEVGRAVPSIKEDNDYVGSIFAKAFEKDLKEVSLRSDDAERAAKRRATLMLMHKWASQLSKSASHLSLASQFLREVLEDELSFHCVSEATFLAYLANPLHHHGAIYRPVKEPTTARYDEYWQQYHALGSHWLPEGDLVQRCLMALLPGITDMRPYEKYLESAYLQKAHVRSQLLSGVETATVCSVFSDADLRAMREEKRLRFVAWNRREFKPRDRVDLELEVKNVSTVSVHVFELDTASYYRSKKQLITESINLTGLVPRAPVEKTIDADPIVSQVVTFTDLFKPKRGLYVVEFVGGGLSSRALIRVGCLGVVLQTLSKGILLHIVDEQKNVCSASTTGLLVGGRLLKPDATLGSGILIPYGVSEVKETAVLLHDGYAELYALCVPAEKVSFDAQLVINEEAVTRGGLVKMLILPKVSVNSSQVSAATLKKLSVVITSTNAVGLNSMRRWDDVASDAKGKGIVVDFMIPPNTTRIAVQTTAKFYSSASENFMDLSSVKTVDIDIHSGEEVFSMCYVTMEGSDARVHVLGKAGEPYARQRVNVSLSSRFSSSKPTEISCTTDSAGQILLKGVQGVVRAMTVSSDSNGGELLGEYTFANESLQTLPCEYDIVEGDDITFPAVPESDSSLSAKYELVRVDPGIHGVVSDHRDCVQATGKLLRLTHLKEGHYIFRYLLSAVAIRITVHKGIRWAPSPHQFLEKEESLVKMANQRFRLAYTDYHQENHTVSFNVVSSDMSSVEVHALAFTFFPQTLATIKVSLQSLRELDAGETFVFHPSESVFLSEKRLSDETKYVLERKRRSTYMGNTLEKPPALLVRHFVRDTTEDAETLADEEGYKAVDRRERRLPAVECNVAHPSHAMMRSAALMTGLKMASMASAPRHNSTHFEKAMSSQMKRSGGFGGADRGSADYTIDHLRPFLGTAGWASYNIAPDPVTGKVTFEVPAEAGYSTLVFIIKDTRNSITEWRALRTAGSNPHPVAKVAVALGESKTANKVYIAERTAQGLTTGDHTELPDPRSTEFCFVDDVASLAAGLRLIGGVSDLDEWEFVWNWGSLSPAEKLKRYDRYASHELNVFTSFKDKEFFDVVVRPHLASKSRKEIVDWVLLEDRDTLRQYLKPVRFFSGCDVLEQVLLLRLFAQELPVECEALAQAVRERVKAQRQDNTEADRRFDTVLSGRRADQETKACREEITGDSSQRDAMLMEAAVANAIMPGPHGIAPQGMHRIMNVAPFGLSEDLEAELDTEVPDDGGAVVPATLQYRPTGVTKEYQERQYYQGLYFNAGANAFWSDAMQYFATVGLGDGGARPFLPSTFVEAAGSVTEVLAAVALVDIPLVKGTHQSESTRDSFCVTAGSNCILLSKVLKEKGEDRLDLDVMVTQRFCDPFDLYTVEADGGMRVLRNVTEFLPRKLYRCRVLITNASESEQRLNLVTQVPQGAVPVVETEYTSSQEVDVGPLTTHVSEFHFYFPLVGTYTCFPASIVKNGHLVASATVPAKFSVVAKLSTRRMETLQDVLNQGSRADVLAFVEKASIYNTDVFRFDSIYWLLSDASFYRGFLAVLRRRQHFDEVVWSFSIPHGDWPTFMEYLQYRHDYGGWRPQLRVVTSEKTPVLYLSTTALTIMDFEYLEYRPLVNARAHDVGPFRHNIRNRQFRVTYERFLTYLAQKSPHLSAKDYVYFCMYLVLQDRVDTALTAYALIDAPAAKKELKLQFNYLTAYLDLYTDFPALRKARNICTQYLTYPVFAWRNRFIDIANQIAELDGETELLDKEATLETNDAELNRQQAMREGHISCELDAARPGGVKITASNVKEIAVYFYLVDLELLFSQDPFADVGAMDYSFVIPNETVQETRQDGAEAVSRVAVPPTLVHHNMIIQAVSGPLCSSVLYFPATMKATIARNYGSVKVQQVDNNRPLPKVYVKVFARRENGSTAFHKDGYTDLRGTFEYAAVHGEGSRGTKVQQFSLLVLCKEHGALLMRADPVTQMAAVESGARIVASNRLQLAQQSQIANIHNQYVL